MCLEWEAHYSNTRREKNAENRQFLWSPDKKRGGIDNRIKSVRGHGNRKSQRERRKSFFHLLLEPAFVSVKGLKPVNLFTFIFVQKFTAAAESHVCHLEKFLHWKWFVGVWGLREVVGACFWVKNFKWVVFSIGFATRLLLIWDWKVCFKEKFWIENWNLWIM